MGKNGTDVDKEKIKTLTELEEEGSDHSNGTQYEPLEDPDAPIPERKDDE